MSEPDDPSEPPLEDHEVFQRLTEAYEQAVADGRDPPNPPPEVINRWRPKLREKWFTWLAMQRPPHAIVRRPPAGRPGPVPSRPSDYPLPTVPGYQVAAQIGLGGMGVVYRVSEEAMQRDLALKTIRPDMAS